METPGDDDGDYTTWKALPRPLLAWIQDQEGLRIHGEPISSREMLELASQLQDRKTTHRFSDTLASPFVNLAVQVALQYIKEVTRRGSKLTLISTIPGRLNQIIQRQCFKCKKHVLDDAFPRFHKDMPGTYIITVYERSNCGRPDCKGKNAALTPIDPRQEYMRLGNQALEVSVKAKRKAARITTLLRSGSDLNDCAEEVLVQCPNKKCGYQRLVCGRWTIHKPPRFLQPQLSCSACKRGIGYFRVVNPEVPTVTEAALYDVLKRFKAIGCNLAEYPKLPEIIFSTRDTYAERFDMVKKTKNKSYVIDGTHKTPLERKQDTH